MIDGYVFPNSWYKGLVARGEGNIDTALHALEDAAGAVGRREGRWDEAIANDAA